VKEELLGKDPANYVLSSAPYEKKVQSIVCDFAPRPESHFTQPDLAESVPDPCPSAAAILREAAGIVEGARNSSHGDKERSFNVIANLWNDYLRGRKVNEGLNFTPISAVDVAQMMVLMKIARSIQGTPILDHFLDASAYSAIAGELSSGK